MMEKTGKGRGIEKEELSSPSLKTCLQHLRQMRQRGHDTMRKQHDSQKQPRQGKVVEGNCTQTQIHTDTHTHTVTRTQIHLVIRTISFVVGFSERQKAIKSQKEKPVSASQSLLQLQLRRPLHKFNGDCRAKGGGERGAGGGTQLEGGARQGAQCTFFPVKTCWKLK